MRDHDHGHARLLGRQRRRAVDGPAGPGTVTQISAGGYHTCALKTDGNPICWGDDIIGQTTIPPNLGTVTQLDAGSGTLVRDQDRRQPVCWGDNLDGQATIPPDIGNVTQISAGGFHSCAVTTAGNPVCWGFNDDGERTIPPELGTVTQISAGVYFTCAIKPGATAVCWGSNYDGQALVPPHNTTRPQITGTPKVGSTVSATAGVWDNSPTSFTYAWSRCTTNNTLATCTTIAGADQSSYALSVDDDTRYLRIVVTATNASGSVAQHSYPVKITRVRPAQHRASDDRLDAEGRGSLLTATSGDWTNSPTAYAYAWQLNAAPRTTRLRHARRSPGAVPGDLHAGRG